MTDSAAHAWVASFYEARASGAPDRIAPFLHDDVEWSINGPIDLLSFCGVYRGKAAVIDLCTRQIESVFHIFAYTPEQVIVEGPRAVILMRITARQKQDRRVISYRCANFITFENDKIISFLSLIDSYDAVTQVLGQPLGPTAELNASRDCVMV